MSVSFLTTERSVTPIYPTVAKMPKDAAKRKEKITEGLAEPYSVETIRIPPRKAPAPQPNPKADSNHPIRVALAFGLISENKVAI